MKLIRLNTTEQLIFFMNIKEMVSIEYDNVIQSGILELVTEDLVKIKGAYYVRGQCDIYMTLTSVQ